MFKRVTKVSCQAVPVAIEQAWIVHDDGDMSGPYRVVGHAMCSLLESVEEPVKDRNAWEYILENGFNLLNEGGFYWLLVTPRGGCECPRWLSDEFVFFTEEGALERKREILETRAMHETRMKKRAKHRAG